MTLDCWNVEEIKHLLEIRRGHCFQMGGEARIKMSVSAPTSQASCARVSGKFEAKLASDFPDGVYESWDA